jgi:hypothetical protein
MTASFLKKLLEKQAGSKVASDRYILGSGIKGRIFKERGFGGCAPTTPNIILSYLGLPAIIPDDKLTRYLLLPRDRDDKSKFLAQAGFTLKNPNALKAAIQVLVGNIEAVIDTQNEYRTFFLVIGEITGTENRNLSVTTIWMKRAIDQQFQFVTLKPCKERKL